MKVGIIFLSKLISKIVRFLKLGGGTALPGLFIEKYLPSIITKLTKEFDCIVLITGTNGKTTTQKLVSHLLVNSNIPVISNKSGANLLRGIASALVEHASLTGKYKAKIAIFEVEEGTMPKATEFIAAHHIVVTNLFRDQLDAYGEVTITRKYIVDAIKQLPKAHVFLHGDDKNTATIASEISNEVTLFQVEDKRVKNILYERSFVRAKNIAKSVQVLKAKNVHLESDLTCRFDVSGIGRSIYQLHLGVPGIHQIYNALGAIAVTKTITKIAAGEYNRLFEAFSPAFGRGEVIKIHGKELQILLIKNPASFTANLLMLQSVPHLHLFFIINDNIADGRDVSWLWDAQLETLQNAIISSITVSGTRAHDMYLRLKYANLRNLTIEVEANLTKAFDIALSKVRGEETLYVLPTYTAMLDIRKKIGSIVKIKEFWR